MKVIFFVLLAGCAVKCNAQNTNYFVVNMPPEAQRSTPMQVYWNIPTMQCDSKKVFFKDLYDRYGITQNRDDRFRGEKITIMYDPGFFPALLSNGSSNEFKLRNGGVPQEGNYADHAKRFAKDINDQIPDPEFDGVAVIDFESWRPVFRQNWGTLEPYRNISYELERQKHWWWPKNLLEGVARARFEKAGKIFMQNTIALAKELRPRARWGYYAYPYCYNTKTSACSDDTMAENDRLNWLWEESTALFPSIYSSKSLYTNQLVAMVTGRIKEASRVNKNAIILPYFWYRYRDGGFMDKKDLDAVLKAIYESPAAGLIAWGSSSDVNTVAKCQDLLSFLNTTLGPAIAKYTKRNKKDTTENLSIETEKPEALNEEGFNERISVAKDYKVTPYIEHGNRKSGVANSKTFAMDVPETTTLNAPTVTDTEKVDFEKVVHIFENLNNETVTQLNDETLDSESDMTDLLIQLLKTITCDCSKRDCTTQTISQTIPTTTESTTLSATDKPTFADQDYVTIIEVATDSPQKCKHYSTKNVETTTMEPTTRPDVDYKENMATLELLRQKALCNSKFFEKIIQAFPLSDIAIKCSALETTTESLLDAIEKELVEADLNPKNLYKDECFQKETDHREQIPNSVANMKNDQVVRLIRVLKNSLIPYE